MSLRGFKFKFKKERGAEGCKMDIEEEKASKQEGEDERIKKEKKEKEEEKEEMKTDNVEEDDLMTEEDKGSNKGLSEMDDKAEMDTNEEMDVNKQDIINWLEKQEIHVNQEEEEDLLLPAFHFEDAVGLMPVEIHIPVVSVDAEKSKPQKSQKNKMPFMPGNTDDEDEDGPYYKRNVQDGQDAPAFDFDSDLESCASYNTMYSSESDNLISYNAKRYEEFSDTESEKNISDSSSSSSVEDMEPWSSDESGIVPLQENQALAEPSGSKKGKSKKTCLKGKNRGTLHLPLSGCTTLIKKKKKKKKLDSTMFVHTISIVMREVLKHLPLSSWWNLKKSCSALYNNEQLNSVSFLRHCLQYNVRNSSTNRFFWDSAFLNGLFLPNAGRAIARQKYLGGKRIIPLVLQNIHPNQPMLHHALWGCKANEFKMIEMDNFSPVPPKKDGPYYKAERPSFEMVHLPKNAPRPYGNCIAVVSHDDRVGIYNPRSWTLMSEALLESRKIFSHIACNAEGTRIVVFMANNKKVEKERVYKYLNGRFIDANLEIYSLDEENGLQYKRSVWLDQDLDRSVSRNCLWTDNHLIIGCYAKDELSKVVFRRVSLDDDSKKEFVPYRAFGSPSNNRVVYDTPKYQTLIPHADSSLEAPPLLCWLRPCTDTETFSVVHHQIVFFENAFCENKRPVQYVMDFDPLYSVKALARLVSPDVVLILTSVKDDTWCRGEVSVKVKKFYSKEENSDLESDDCEDCEHPFQSWHARVKMLKLFAWKVGSEEANCIRVLHLERTGVRRDRLVVTSTDFESALCRPSNNSPVRILVDGYSVVIPTKQSFFYTAVTNLTSNIEMLYNRICDLQMPYVFFREGVIIQLTCITRTSLPLPASEEIRGYTDKLFFAVKVFVDTWTLKNVLQDRRFLKNTPYLHKMRPIKTNLETRTIHMVDLLVEDGYSEKGMENKFGKKVLRLAYRNVGPLASSNRFYFDLRKN